MFFLTVTFAGTFGIFQMARIRAVLAAAVALQNVCAGTLSDATEQDLKIEPNNELGEISHSSVDLLGGFLDVRMPQQARERAQKVPEEMSDARCMRGANAGAAPSQIAKTQKETDTLFEQGGAFGAEGKSAEASIEAT